MEVTYQCPRANLTMKYNQRSDDTPRGTIVKGYVLGIRTDPEQLCFSWMRSMIMRSLAHGIPKAHGNSRGNHILLALEMTLVDCPVPSLGWPTDRSRVDDSHCGVACFSHLLLPIFFCCGDIILWISGLRRSDEVTDLQSITLRRWRQKEFVRRVCVGACMPWRSTSSICSEWMPTRNKMCCFWTAGKGEWFKSQNSKHGNKTTWQ